MTHVTTVEVDTGIGDRVMVDVEVDPVEDTYRIRFSGELLRQRPEAITASIQLAILQMAWLAQAGTPA